MLIKVGCVCSKINPQDGLVILTGSLIFIYLKPSYKSAQISIRKIVLLN